MAFERQVIVSDFVSFLIVQLDDLFTVFISPSYPKSSLLADACVGLKFKVGLK
jgi:hypothetical protein